MLLPGKVKVRYKSDTHLHHPTSQPCQQCLGKWMAVPAIKPCSASSQQRYDTKAARCSLTTFSPGGPRAHSKPHPAGISSGMVPRLGAKVMRSARCAGISSHQRRRRSWTVSNAPGLDASVQDRHSGRRGAVEPPEVLRILEE